MKLDTANIIRIGAALMTVLIILSVSWPVYGVPLATIWLGVIIWQLYRRRRQGKG
jgi:hypothetical protein